MRKVVVVTKNCALTFNTAKDTNIFGANLLASDINLDIAGNLTLKSRQNLSESDSYSIGANVGMSGGQSLVVPGSTSKTSSSSYQNPLNGGINGGSVGFNLGNGYSNRAWVDQVSSIIGTNSVNINVGTKDINNQDPNKRNDYLANTGNTNITGAMIANITNIPDSVFASYENQSVAIQSFLNSGEAIDGGNLTLNTASLTYSDLKNHNVSESNSFGLSAQFGKKPSNPAMPDQLDLNLSLQGSESSSTTKATIGSGIINISGNPATDLQTANLNRDITQNEQNKKTVITSDFDAELKIPTMILTNPTEFGNQVKGGVDILTSEEAKDIYGKVWASPNTAIGLTIGGVGYLYGMATGQEVKITLGNNAVQFEGNPLVNRGLTIGNTISYSGIGNGSGGPDALLGSSYIGKTTFESSDGKLIGPTIGDHESWHTNQYETWGPLFTPAYLVNGLINSNKALPGEPLIFHSGNDFEINADIGSFEKFKERNKN